MGLRASTLVVDSATITASVPRAIILSKVFSKSFLVPASTKTTSSKPAAVATDCSSRKARCSAAISGLPNHATRRVRGIKFEQQFDLLADNLCSEKTHAGYIASWAREA